MFHRAILATVAVVCVAFAASPALAGKVNSQSTGTCAFVAPDLVVADGLPNGEILNFFVTDASGTTGWVLGFADDGTWSVHVPVPNGPTTYEFASRTSGKDGKRYTVFARCSTP